MPVGRFGVGERIGIDLGERIGIGLGERIGIGLGEQRGVGGGKWLGECQWIGERERRRLPAGFGFGLRFGFWIGLGVGGRIREQLTTRPVESAPGLLAGEPLLSLGDRCNMGPRQVKRTSVLPAPRQRPDERCTLHAFPPNVDAGGTCLRGDAG